MCAVSGCPGLVVGLGYCDKHYRRLKTTGSPADPTPRSAEERFWSFVDQQAPAGCWLWTGGGWPSGYGSMRGPEGSKVPVHRFSYELHAGPIPEDLVIDHLCRNRRCVNPIHLEPVTSRENIIRGEGMAGRYARRDSCIRGHSFDPPNGYIAKKGHRACHACDEIRREQKRLTYRAAAEAPRRDS